MSITFDGVSLQDSTHVTRFIKHDSLPVRTLATLKIARQDGVTIVSDIYDYKVIEVQGVIKADSQENLEIAIDEFKELISRRQKELDVDYAGSTRRYIATAINPNDAIQRDHYHIGFAPYKIHFLVPSGMGKDPSQVTNNFAAITDWQYSSSIEITGTHPARPKITITLSTAGTCDAVQFTNTTTNTQITITKDDGDFSDDDIIVIDCDKKEVTLNGISYVFAGVFPVFEKGINLFSVVFLGDSAGIDQSQTDADSDQLMDTDTIHIAQGFKPSLTDVLPRVDLLVKKTWTDAKYYISDGNTAQSFSADGPRRTLVKDSNSVLHAVYVRKDIVGANGAYNEIYYSKSINGGRTWTETALTSDSYGDQRYPSMVVDSNNYLWVVWVGKRNGTDTYESVRAINYTTSWQAIEDVVTGATNRNYNCACVLDSSDNLHVIFYRWVSDFRVSYIKRSGTWGAITDVHTGLTYITSVNCSIVIESDDTPHAIYARNVAGDSYVRVWHSKWGGASWNTPVAVSLDTIGSVNIFSAAVDLNDNIHVAFCKYNRQAYYSKWAGSSWTTESIKDPIGELKSISVDNQNNVHILSEAYGNARHTYYNGEEWSNPLGLTGADERITRASLISALFPQADSVPTCNIESGFIFQVANYDSVNKTTINLYYDLIVEIQTDDASDPSGTIVENGLGAINNRDINGSPSWLACTFVTAPSLTSGVLYHIVIRTFAVYSTGRNYVWRHNSEGGYSDGMLKISIDGGSNWIDQSDEDAAFKTYKGSTADQTADVDINYYKTYL